MPKEQSRLKVQLKVGEEVNDVLASRGDET